MFSRELHYLKFPDRLAHAWNTEGKIEQHCLIVTRCFREEEQKIKPIITKYGYPFIFVAQIADSQASSQI